MALRASLGDGLVYPPRGITPRSVQRFIWSQTIKPNEANECVVKDLGK